jgi:putative membrane protein (TIGR04086 family)
MEPVKKAADIRMTSPLFTGMIYSFFSMGIAALILSLLLSFTKQNEDSLPFITYLVHAASVFIGSYVCGKRTGNKGWYHGGLLGLLYGIIILTVGFLAWDHGFFAVHSLVWIVSAFLIGALGGIIGVNNTK